MSIQHPLWRQRRRTVGSLLSVFLIFCTVIGGILGPWMIPPSQGRAAPLLQQPILAKSEESDFSHDGYASYGEVITYTLRYEIPTGTALTNAHLEDVFNDGNSNNLRTDYVDYTGPVPIGGTPPAPPVTFTVTPRDGRPILHWGLGDYDNNSGSTWIYEIYYHVRVRWDNNGNTTRQAKNIATLDWQEAGPIATPELIVNLRQPANMSFDKNQVPDPSQELDPGDPITWTLAFRNNTGPTQGTAYDLLITDTMPAGTTFDSVFPVTATYSQIGNQIIFSRDELLTSTQFTYYGVKAFIPPTDNVAHDRLYNEGRLYRTSAPGDVPDERQYADISDSTTAYIRNVSIGKAQVSPVYGTYNSKRQAEAGEHFTITIAFTVPQGIVIYRPVLRVLLADGLTFTNPISPTDNPSPITNPGDQDPYRPSGYWLQETWPEMASIIDTDDGPVSVKYIFRAQVLQTKWLEPSQIGVDIAHNANLNIVPILRWSNNPSQPIDPQHQYFRQRNDTCDGQNVGCVKFLRPDLRYQNTNSGSKITYDFPGSQFGGGAVISFTLNLRNRSENPTHPPAYDVVLTDTLSALLTYSDAVPAPDYIDYAPDGSTHLHWDMGSGNPIMPPPDREIFTIWATMPTTMVAGMTVTSTAQANYTTFLEPDPNNADYVDRPYTAQAVVQGGLAVKKYVTPANNVRIGDLVTYTVQMTLNPGMVMYTPAFADKLPLGFHFTGTMEIENGTIVTGPVQIALPADPRYERLSWGLATIDNTSGSVPVYVTIRYNARQTGWDSRTPKQPVYASSQGDMVNAQTARNELSACWPAYPGSPIRYCLATPLPYAETKVVQPYLATVGGYTFQKLRPEYPPTREYEVGALVNFSLPLKNSGKGTAYEVKIHDILPPGVAIYNWSLTNLNPPSPPVAFLDTPVQGETGVISWTLDQLDDGQSVNLTYNGMILSNAVAGDLLTNTAYIPDYTSLPGADGFERSYADFDGAFVNDPIPVPSDAPWFSVRGVSIAKSDMQDPISPGEILTYTLEFGNSSLAYDATSVKITDTYDAHLSFLNYTTNRGGMTVSHDPINHRIVWSIPLLSKGGTITDWWIKPYFVLNGPLDQGMSALLNTAEIDGQGDMTGKVVRVEETAVNLPFMTIGKTGSPGLVAPGQTLVYTISFQNIGELAATGVTIHETYDPNITFLMATPPPYTGTTDLWHWEPLDPTESGAIEVTVRVNRPVPAGVEQLTNRVSIACNEVYDTDAAPTYTSLSVPKLVMDITDSVDPVDEGAPLTYWIDVDNQGVAATSTVLTDTLDPYTVFSSANPWPINNCVGGVCIWNLGTVTPGEHRQIQLDVVVAASIPGGVVRLVNRAQIGSWEITPGDVQTIEYTQIAGRLGNVVYLPVVFK